MAEPNGKGAHAIEAKGLVRRYGQRRVLDAVDLALEPGKLVALTGVSGVGKTTLLRLLAGLDMPDEGEIRIAGRLASDGPRSLVPPHARGFAMVFQQPALWPHMTVFEHACFGLAEVPDAAGVAQAMLDRLGIAALARAYPAELSGGEAARVALARALAPSPKCLLLDEPLAHLHADLRRELAGIVGEITRTNGTATLIVTHSPADLDGSADASLRLEQGRLAPA